MMLGIMTDQYPTQAVAQFFNTVAAGIPWTRSAHDEYHKTVAGLPLGYMSEPYASKRLFALDPSESRGHGLEPGKLWKSIFLGTSTTRSPCPPGGSWAR